MRTLGRRRAWNKRLLALFLIFFAAATPQRADAFIFRALGGLVRGIGAGLGGILRLAGRGLGFVFRGATGLIGTLLGFRRIAPRMAPMRTSQAPLFRLSMLPDSTGPPAAGSAGATTGGSVQGLALADVPAN